MKLPGLITMILLLALLLVGCGRDGNTPEPDTEESPPTGQGSAPEMPEDLDDVVIHMERTPCFGRCPVYQVTIEGHGHVEYIGENFVAVEGVQEAEISEEQVRELISAFYEAGFFEMEERYESNITDLPSTTTTITIGNVTKSVYNYAGAPEALQTLEDTIDRISGAAEWVGAEEG